MLTIESIPSIAYADAAAIPATGADEAYRLLETEFGRFMQVIESLEPEDWTRPTACTAWNVRDMVAHQAGGYASGTGYGELIRQYARIPGKGQLPEDAINALQLRERADKTPRELIAELHRVGPVAARQWAYGFRVAKFLTELVPVPHAVAGSISLQYLMWVTHSRDTWMHRLDICRATGRPFEQTAGHDGRIAALVMRDVARLLAPRLGGGTLVFELTGIAGGTWQVGGGATRAAVRMDVLDFNIFASGRFTYEEALARAGFSGDGDYARQTLKQVLVLY